MTARHRDCDTGEAATQVAKDLGMSRATLYRRIATLNISLNPYPTLKVLIEVRMLIGEPCGSTWPPIMAPTVA